MLRGFFTKQDYSAHRKTTGQSCSRVKKTTSSKTFNTNVDPCEACGLYKQCLTPKMEPTGEGSLGVLVVGEAPGEEEDKRGIQFIGPAGQLFRDHLRKFRLDLDQDFWKINAVNCRPPNNRKPTKKELKCCWPRVEKAIKEFKPRFIWLMGGTAVESFYMGRFSDCSISRWRRLCIPEPRFNAWVIPLFHPSYVLRNKDDLLESVFEKDLRWAISCLDKPEPTFVDPTEKVEMLTDVDDVIDVLGEVLRDKKVIAFDYETTGLKPYKEGHKILTISLCFDDDKSYSFPYQYKSYWTENQFKEIHRLWMKILEEVPLVAHNLKFEHKWSKVIMGVEPRNWVWDTMTTAHIIDCRSGFTGLKFQAYLNWGIEGYEQDMKRYIKASSPHDFNKLESAPLDLLLLYNGIDALVTYWLYNKQRKQIRGGLRKANSLFFEGLLALADAESQGICMNEDYYEYMDRKLAVEIEKVEQELLSSKEAKLFRKKMKREIDLNSSHDLRILFYDLLKIEPTKLTSKGNPSVDHETLVSLNLPFAEKLVELRKLKKIRDTYLAQFRREIVNGKMYPVFNLHIARSYRSSSDSPNFQNIPVRDEEAKKVTRGGIIPSKGNRIAEIDYSSIEVRIAACYTKDPVLISYINDPSSDMHRDQAKEIFVLNDKQVTKKIRFYAKNCFVFPEFYGSYYRNCARNLWENVVEGGLETGDGISVREHLKRVGIRNYKRFEDHVREVENNFWDRFRVFKEWQEYIVDFYRRKGYVEMFFGHRRTGYLTRNMVINTPIQGTAFHCLLWSFIRLNKIRKEEGWRTSLIGQIHDSIVFDLDPDEQEYVLDTTKRVMCEDIRKENPWIIVPLDIEVELTPIDGSWYEKEAIKEDNVWKLTV